MATIDYILGKTKSASADDDEGRVAPLTRQDGNIESPKDKQADAEPPKDKQADTDENGGTAAANQIPANNKIVPPNPQALKPTVNTDAKGMVDAPGKGSAPLAQRNSNAPKSPKDMSYVELYEMMNPDKPETAEERLKREKKEKREAMFSAIGDGISALSNLFFTTRYAPNAYDPSRGMSAATKERWEKLRKEREARRREYNDGYWRALMMDRDKDRDDRNWRHTIEREIKSDRWREVQEARKQNKDEFDAQKRQLELQLLQGKITKEDYLTEQERLETEYMKANNMKMPVKPKPNSGGNRGSSSGGGSGRAGEYPWYDSDGNKHYAHSYEAMRQNAIDHGTWNEQTQESSSERTTKDRRGRSKGSTSTKTTKPAKGHSSAPKGKKPNPMGGGSTGNQKKKNPMS